MTNEEHSSFGFSPASAENGERRRWPRAADSFTPAIGRARLLPRVAHHYPSLRPNGWYKVIGYNPEAIEPRARPGYLWIEVDGRPRQVWAGHFDVSQSGSGEHSSQSPDR
jgi:hypothetical protein